MISAPDLADYFVEVADTLVGDFDIIAFLDRLTVTAAEVGGAAAAGLLLSANRGEVRLMAASNESGETLELLQIQQHDGPCLECASRGEAIVNADLEGAVERWPHFAPRALEAGFRSVHAFPMRLRGDVVGALNLFGTEKAPFDAGDVRIVQALADVATVAILQERNLAQAEIIQEQLHAALETRVVIEQAKGSLAQENGISLAEAFDVLRSRARSGRKRMAEVANEVLAPLEPRGGA